MDLAALIWVEAKAQANIIVLSFSYCTFRGLDKFCDGGELSERQQAGGGGFSIYIASFARKNSM